MRSILCFASLWLLVGCVADPLGPGNSDGGACDGGACARPCIADGSALGPRSITLAAPTVFPGESEIVTIETTSGCLPVTGLYGTFESASHSGLVAFAAHRSSDGGSWSAEVPVPPNAGCGDWHLRELHIVDAGYNRADLDASDPVVASAHFSTESRLTPSCCDITAPDVHAIRISPSTISNTVDNPVTVTIDVTDDCSGVASVSGYLMGPTRPGEAPPRIGFSASPAADGWTAILIVPKLSMKGTWRVGYLQVADRARNIRYLNAATDPILDGATFEVQ